jgi:ABC-type branched-subunit amino acid transport system substrate-binding protein
MSDIEDGAAHSRRDFLRRAGLIGAAGVFAPAFLAACGSDKKSTGSGATTTAGGGGGGGATGNLASILKIDPNGKNGKGVDFSMASVLALTGSGSFYGKTMTSGIELAVKHIAAAGGPNFKVK